MLPLSVYLLTFILAFSNAVHVPRIVWSRLLGALAVGTVAVFWIFFRGHPLLLVVVHPLLLFAIGMVCHGRLAADRPPASQLTAFYLLIALGGMLGGAFNTLVAPAVFDDQKHPERYALYLSQAGIGLPDREFYLRDEFKPQKERYGKYVAHMLRLAGWDEPDRNAAAIVQ